MNCIDSDPGTSANSCSVAVAGIACGSDLWAPKDGGSALVDGIWDNANNAADSFWHSPGNKSAMPCCSGVLEAAGFAAGFDVGYSTNFAVKAVLCLVVGPEACCAGCVMTAATWGGSGTGETFAGTCQAGFIDCREGCDAAGSPTLLLAAGSGLDFGVCDVGPACCSNSKGSRPVGPASAPRASALLAVERARTSASYPLVNPPCGAYGDRYLDESLWANVSKPYFIKN